MAPDAAPALQAVLFALLAADADLATLCGGRIHDRRPEPPAFPHVIIGEAESFDDGTKTGAGQVHSLTIHVWSRYRGRIEAKRILAALNAAVHRRVMDLGPAVRWVDGRVIHAGVLDDPDGVTSHGVLRLRVVTEAV